MRGFVSAVRYHSVDFGMLFYQFVIYVVESYTVMYIAGSYFYFQNIAMLVADGVGFVCHLFLVVAFYKHPRIRVGGTLGDGFLLGFLFPLFQLLFGCIVSFLSSCRRWIAVLFLIRFSFLRGIRIQSNI